MAFLTLDSIMSASNDPQTVKEQYLTDKYLRVRQEIHEKYTVPKINYIDWVIDSVQWRGDERVLDIGCGSGAYFTSIQKLQSEVRYYGLDFSQGMLEKHPAQTNLTLGNAQALPFDTDSFDVIMANHMLYHVPDIDEALVEFKRILKPGGVIVAATNSQQNMPELQVLMRRAIVLLSRVGASQIQPPLPDSHLFALENGARQLARHFYAVVRHDLPSTLIFPEIDPVMDYLESTRMMREPQLPDDVTWEDVMMIMRQQITHLIHHLGELSVRKEVGVLIASDSGDFIQDFVQSRINILPKN